MTIEPIELSDMEMLNAMKPADWDDLTPSIRFYLQTTYSQPLKFIENGIIVGMGVTISHGDTAWLGQIIVHPDHRNRGLGRHITQTLIDRLRETGIATILLIATPLGGYVYRKLGFETEGDYVFYREGTVDPSTSSQIIPLHASHLDAVLELDRNVSGENRKMLITGHLQEGLVFADDSEVKGFYLPAVGEGLVVAADEVAGLELMKMRLNKVPRIALMEGNTHAIAFLQQHGFREFKRGTRMWLGKRVPFNQSMLYGRISGSLG